MTRTESAAEVFDALGKDYEAAFRTATAQREAITALIESLPPKAKVLDLGSGTGRPTAELLAAAGHDVTGYDVAPKMVEIARAQVPAARFELGDQRELTFEDGSWDAVTTFFSLLQLTRAEQEAVIGRVATWVKPGGLVLVATVPADVDGLDIVFMGHPVREQLRPRGTRRAAARGRARDRPRGAGGVRPGPPRCHPRAARLSHRAPAFVSQSWRQPLTGKITRRI
ncbi:class I SAM-dependent methyltransferase [Amycolatopsis sp., V23-08]|uniref:Class I SAM-dependent methyltransferase n=1 Tax=Amycolatopsis heterodermiae TaxID=3110235 RepID=A0ABU5QVJ1_9PSEU|nr:class I SAM-dependent methyltransferase [Amycolatopsis sp., V23-08]MEA5357937.1 class I SAM-dependent methyltransferase [Amycolatopsis sp., V23-08]